MSLMSMSVFLGTCNATGTRAQLRWIDLSGATKPHDPTGRKAEQETFEGNTMDSKAPLLQGSTVKRNYDIRPKEWISTESTDSPKIAPLDSAVNRMRYIGSNWC